MKIQSDEKTKVCADCKYSKWRFIEMLTYGSIASGYSCTYEEVVHTKTNLVTGQVIRTRTLTRCKDARHSGFHCGPEGIHWEPNEVWRNKKFNLFKLIKVIKENE